MTKPTKWPSLIRVFAVLMKKHWVPSYPLSTQRRSDWADVQADLSLCWVHMPFHWFCHEMAHLNFMILFSKHNNFTNCALIEKEVFASVRKQKLTSFGVSVDLVLCQSKTCCQLLFKFSRAVFLNGNLHFSMFSALSVILNIKPINLPAGQLCQPLLQLQSTVLFQYFWGDQVWLPTGSQG